MQENICDGVGLQQRSRLQAGHLGKSGLHHACFPRNSRTVIYRNISEQLSNSFNYLARPFFTCFWKTPRLSWSICFSSLLSSVYLSLHHCIKGKFNFYITFNFRYSQGRSHWGSQEGHGPPHFSFRTKQGPKVSVSNITDIAFYGCSEIIRTRNFTIFTVYVTIFGQFMAAFYFF